MYNQENRSLAPGRIFSDTMKYFSENFKMIFLITIIVYIPLNSILFVFNEYFSGSDFTTSFRFAQLLEGLIGIITTIAIIHLIKERTLDRNPSLGEVFSNAFSKWISVITTNIIFTIFFIGLFLLLIIPGIIFGVYWTFTVESVVLRNRYGRDALKYSKELVEGHWWAVFGYDILLFCFVILVIAISIIPYTFMPENISSNYFINIGLDLVTDIIVSFTVVFATILFLNLENCCGIMSAGEELSSIDE